MRVVSVGSARRPLQGWLHEKDRGNSPHAEHVVEPESGRKFPTLWAEPARLLITGAASGGAYAATEVSAWPGWARPAYVHHEVDECFYIADGEFEVELDDQPQQVRLRRGSLLYVPRGVARSLCNPGASTGRLLLL